MPEILAPCGSMQSLTAALRAGCTAVYMGGESFSARQNAVNFTNEEIKTAVFECHKRDVKVYIAINTILFDSQLEECSAWVQRCAEMGVDGIITQDFALIEIVRKCCPELEIHASTQMSIHTRDGVLLAKRLGFSRAVLARELALDTITQLSALGIQTEVFVHGALCMSVSGQCYMSAVIGSRSANRGLCAQACRLPCTAIRGKERYDLSLKDMSCYDSVGKLTDAGVSSLKIEGRMKRPEYVAMAVKSLSLALSGKPYDKQTLCDVFSRNGFTDGYLYGKTGAQMFGVRQREDAEASARALPKIHELYRHEEKRSRIRLTLTLKSGESARLCAADESGNFTEVFGEIPQLAKSKACDEQSALKQLEKLGDTIYELEDISCEIDEGLFFAPSQLNAMRKALCKRLDEVRACVNTKAVDFTPCDLLDFEEAKISGKPKIRIAVTNLRQLERINFDDIELCAVSLNDIQRAAKIYPVSKLMIAMPRFTFDEAAQRTLLKSAKEIGIEHMLAANLAHIKSAEDYGFKLHLDYGLNLANSAALYTSKRLGAQDAVVSFELKAPQINALKKPLPIGIFAYGRLPLMLTVNCPISQAVGCGGCTGKVIDRTSREFMVKCSRKSGYVQILNSDILYLAHRLDRFSGADFYMLSFFEESADEVRKIICDYTNGTDKKPDGNYTAGLYFRGVK